MCRKILFTALIFLIYSLPASARFKKLVFEPYLGFEYGKWSTIQKNTTSSSTVVYDLKGDALGYFLGSKVLYKMKRRFLIGADLQYGITNLYYVQDPASSKDDSFENSSSNKLALGLTFGYFIPRWSLKVNYYPLNTLSLSKDFITGSTEISYSGSALTIEVSFNLHKKININLGYRINYFKKAKYGDAEVEMPGALGSVYYTEFTNKSTVAYLSYLF